MVRRETCRGHTVADLLGNGLRMSGVAVAVEQRVVQPISNIAIAPGMRIEIVRAVAATSCKGRCCEESRGYQSPSVPLPLLLSDWRVGTRSRARPHHNTHKMRKGFEPPVSCPTRVPVGTFPAPMSSRQHAMTERGG